MGPGVRLRVGLGGGLEVRVHKLYEMWVKNLGFKNMCKKRGVKNFVVKNYGVKKFVLKTQDVKKTDLLKN